MQSRTQCTLHAFLSGLILVSVTWFWLIPLIAHADEPVPSQPPLIALPAQPHDVPWPTERWPEGSPDGSVDLAAVDAAVAEIFAPIGPAGVPDTRALLIVQHGRIVFERYAEGFGPVSRFHTWSMAKSWTHALAGILVRKGVLELDAPAPIPAWHELESDPRQKVTLRHLLNMTSGIANGDFGDSPPLPGEFLQGMLFGSGATDATTFAANAELAFEPGTRWAYSTASTTLVSGIVGRAVADDAVGRRAFIRTELLDPIGASDVVFEFDRAGHFLGGSHVWGTARDFARFGLLYLRGGIWDQRRIVEESWVDFGRTRAPVSNNGTHGAHFWLNLKPSENQFVLLPDGPTSVFEANGNAGQYVVMVPTHDIVIVRLGEMHSTTWDESNGRLAKLLAAFPAMGNSR